MSPAENSHPNSKTKHQMNTKPQAEHSSLYRKYRPQNWAEVSGQSHIVKVLEEEVKKDRPCHAFLFAGSRGTGKTTIARIFAANIGTAPEDVYEIDAASITGVDDIRVLNESVHTLPLSSKFKVYILDEVHMLSKSAFNAFLKTLEEPPRHVIFILATTELHKIPETIQSRCQTFYFNKPSVQTLRELVIQIGAKENVTIASDAAELISMVGNGSFRDTLSALQTVIGVGGKKELSRTDVEEVLGLPAHMLVEQFIESIEKKNLPLGLEALGKVHVGNLDVQIFAEQVIGQLRTLLIEGVKGAGNGAQMTEQRLRMIELLIGAKEQLGKTYISVLPLELALVRFFEVK